MSAFVSKKKKQIVMLHCQKKKISICTLWYRYEWCWLCKLSFFLNKKKTSQRINRVPELTKQALSLRTLYIDPENTVCTAAAETESVLWADLCWQSQAFNLNPSRCTVLCLPQSLTYFLNRLVWKRTPLNDVHSNRTLIVIFEIYTFYYHFLLLLE